jgi:glycerate dehydrogenase
MTGDLIVITDAFTLNPGDLNWAKFETLGRVRIYPRTAANELAERCSDASIIVTNKTPIPATFIEGVQNLKMIAVTATGYNVVDIEAAARKNIPVCNVPGYGTDSVAQHTFALILELTNHVGSNSLTVRNGDWSRSDDWCYSVAPLAELSGKTLGIVGYGKIGQKVAEIAKAFGMRPIHSSKGTGTKDIYEDSVREVFANSDIVSLHCPLTADNAGFVNRHLLSIMKPTSLLINTARGQLINEGDLAEALRLGTISGAGLDVLSKEPPPHDHPLIALQNCVITPHNAWLSLEARRRIMDTTFANIQSALNGKWRHVVNMKIG